MAESTAEPTTAPAKVKKPKVIVPPDEREFLKITKLLFSTLTGRACRYVYFNIKPGGLVFSNSTSSPPNDEHGDRLMDYKVGELGLHFVAVNHRLFMDKMRELLNIPATGCYVVICTTVATILNKYRIKDLHRLYDLDGKCYLAPKTTTKPDPKWWVGMPVTNFHAVSNLRTWNSYADAIGSEEFEQQFPHVRVAASSDLPVVNRVYYRDVPIEVFKDDQGQPLLKNTTEHLRFMGIDGISTVSIQSFLQKNTQPYTYELYLWLVDQRYVLCATLYKDNLIEVTTLRPNVMGIPVPSSIQFETNNLLAE